MKNYTIGLDLGINNVGWAVINNETNVIEDRGVRLYSKSGDAKNRREARNVRRRLKRRDNRIDDTMNLLNSINFPSKQTIDGLLIEKRYKGIKEQLSKQEICNVIGFLISYRGYIPYGDEEVQFVTLNGKLPCEYYYEIYKNNGYYRNRNLVVKNEDNLKEINRLFEVQSIYYPELNKILCSIQEIFKRKRKFWEGPGSINSLTPYGRFKTKKDVENYKEHKALDPSYETYIYENLIAKCKYVINEKCAPKLNFYSENFNLLNDFINIRFKETEEIKNQDYISVEKDIIKINSKGLNAIKNYCLNNVTLTYKSIFKDIFGTTIENVMGYRIDKKEKPEFSTFNYYRSCIKKFNDENLSSDLLKNIVSYNRIMYIFNIAPGKIELFNMLHGDKIINYEFNQKELDTLYTLYSKFKGTTSFGYCSFSEKLLIRAIKDMEKDCQNFMQVSRKYDYEKESREYFIKNYNNSLEGIPKMSTKYIDDIIASPQVKKTLRQSVKVINAIIKEYKCYPSVISVESTKDNELNGKEARKEIVKMQKHNEMLRTKAAILIKNNFGESSVNETNIEKAMLYEESNGHCMYCNEPISIDNIISAGLDIDHILPYSKSFNDSFENKCLVCSNCNRKKLDRTPYQYLSSLKMFEEFQERVENLDISDAKKSNLLFKDNIDKYKTRFFNRNLRDTAYATKELINQINIFNYYLKSNFNDTHINTFSTPGILTHEMRKKYDLDKDRDDGVYHHCVDASIIASIPNTSLGKFLIESQNNPKFYIQEHDKIENKIGYLKSIPLDNTIEQIKMINNDNTKTSMQLNKNPNEALSNANTIKIIEKEDNKQYKIQQINNIYDSNIDMKLLAKLFNDDDNTTTALCFDNNKEQYQMLKDIYLKYKDEKGSPFMNYCLDANGLEDAKKFDYRINGIKMSKKENSPIIIKLRYYISITSPYILEKQTIKTKSNTKIGLDSLAQYCTKIYVDLDKNKFIFLPIYAISMNLKTKELKENDKYYNIFYDKYIGNKRVEFVSDIYNGNYIEVLKGKGGVDTGYYQYFHKTNNILLCKNDSTFTPSDTGFILYNIDILGNKHKVLTKILK